MAEFLSTIEALPLAVALRGSTYAYPLVSAAHILSIGVTVAAVLAIDLRVLGWLSALPSAVILPVLRRAVALAFSAAVVTGLLLFAVQARAYAENPAFLAKLALLALAGANLFLFRVATRSSQVDAWPAGARATAAVSLVVWPAVVVAGRFIGFV